MTPDAIDAELIWRVGQACAGAPWHTDDNLPWEQVLRLGSWPHGISSTVLEARWRVLRCLLPAHPMPLSAALAALDEVRKRCDPDGAPLKGPLKRRLSFPSPTEELGAVNPPPLPMTARGDGAIDLAQLPIFARAQLHNEHTLNRASSLVIQDVEVDLELVARILSADPSLIPHDFEMLALARIFSDCNARLFGAACSASAQPSSPPVIFCLNECVGALLHRPTLPKAGVLLLSGPALRLDKIQLPPAILASQPAVCTCNVATLPEAYTSTLYALAKGPPMLTYPGWRAACRFLTSELFRRIPRLCLLPVTSPPLLRFNSLLSALQALLPLPSWLTVLSQGWPDTALATPHLIAGVSDYFKVQIVILKLGNASRNATVIEWLNRDRRLLVLAEDKSGKAFDEVLSLEKTRMANGEGLQLTLRCSLAPLRVNGTTLPPTEPKESHFLPLTAQLLQFKLDCIRVRLNLCPPVSARTLSANAPPSICPFCHEEQQQASHSTTCKQELHDANDAALTRIDDELLKLGLIRQVVPRDINSVALALVAATANPMPPADLHDLLWNFAKSESFRCDLLSEEHSSALTRAGDLRTATNASLCTLWSIAVYVWAAPVLKCDILLFTENARVCTFFPSDRGQKSPSSMQLREIVQRMSNRTAIALVHVPVRSQDFFHVEWAAPVMPPSPMAKPLGPASLPLSPMMPVRSADLTPPQPILVTRPPPAAPLTSTTLAQLNALLQGQQIKLSDNSAPAANSWWRSLPALLSRLANCNGKLVWYERDVKNPKLWHRRPDGLLPPHCALKTQCAVCEWVTWHEKESHAPVESIRHIFDLVDVEISDDDLAELEIKVPVMAALDDRTSPFSVHHHLRLLFPTMHIPTLRPRLHLSPGFVCGAITTPLRPDGLPLLRFEANLGFDLAGVHLVQIYPNEEQLGPERWQHLLEACGEPPSTRYHVIDSSLRSACDEFYSLLGKRIEPERSVELKAGELMLVPASQPYAIKQWPSQANRQPLVSLSGELAWRGLDAHSTQEAIALMRKVSTAWTPPVLVEAGLLAYLQALEVGAEPEPHQMYYLTTIAPMLDTLLEGELATLRAIRHAEIVEHTTGVDYGELFKCYLCEQQPSNGMVWRSHQPRTLNPHGITSRTYCLTCFAKMERLHFDLSTPYPLQDDLVMDQGILKMTWHGITFRFGHPAKLLAKLNAAVTAVGSATAASPTPSPLLPTF